MAGASSPSRSALKRQRFANRRAEMLAGGWIYYPAQDLFVEKVSTRSKRMTPPGQSQFLPRARQVYGREVFEVPEPIWRLYLEGEPRAILTVDAWVGHPNLAKAPSEGIYDPQGFAVHNEGVVGR